MSRGLGRIERALLDLIEDEDADDVYAAEDAANSIYQTFPCTRAQRVAVLRAAHALARKYPEKITLAGGKGREPLWISRVKRGASRGARTKPPPSGPPPRRARGQAPAPRQRRRESIRQLAEQLLNRPQLGRDVFQRGQPEPIAEIKRSAMNGRARFTNCCPPTRRRRRAAPTAKPPAPANQPRRTATSRRTTKFADHQCCGGRCSCIYPDRYAD